ncbi:MAG: hypothetical protein R3B90_10510 [Planctomycetaceae bacterium]
MMFLMNLGWTVRSYKRDGYFEGLFGFEHLPKAFTWAFYSALLALLRRRTAFNSNPDFAWSAGLLRYVVNLIIANLISSFAFDPDFLGDPAVQGVPERSRPSAGSSSTCPYCSLGPVCGSRLPADRRVSSTTPIVGMARCFSSAISPGFRRAVINDRRIEQGLPPAEKELSDQKVWSDLVYTERPA